MDDSVERNKANFVRFQQELIVGGNMDLLDELMAPTMTVHMDHGVSADTDGQEWTREQFRDAYNRMIGQRTGHRRTIDAIGGEGDTVWARWTIEYVHDREERDIPPTGNQLRYTEWGQMRYDDQNRLVEGWYASNPLTVYAQMGAKVTVEPGA